MKKLLLTIAAVVGTFVAGSGTAWAETTITRPDDAKDVTITWAMSSADDKSAVISDNNAFSTGAGITLTGVAYNGVTDKTSDAQNTLLNGETLTMTKVRPSTAVTAFTTNQTVSFDLTPRKGITFVPTKFSFYIVKLGTGKKNGATDDKTYIQYASKFGTTDPIIHETDLNINRPGSSYNGTTPSFFTQSNFATAAVTSDAPYSLVIYIKNIANNKDIAIAQVSIEGYYYGTAEEETTYAITTSVTPSNAGNINQVPGNSSVVAGESVSFTATPAAGYQFVKWTDGEGNSVSEQATYSIQSVNADVNLIAVFKKLPTIIYAKGEDVEGYVPDSVYGTVGTEVTLPTNTSLYKENATFVGWSDGETTYKAGDKITFKEGDRITLTAAFEANPTATLSEWLDNLSTGYTLSWSFQRSAGAPTLNYENKYGIYTIQAKYGENTVDVPMKVETRDNKVVTDTRGKLNNASSESAAQVNGGTRFTIPVSPGAAITVRRSGGKYNVTIDGKEYTSVESDLTYIYTETETKDLDIEVTSTASTLTLKGIKVTYQPNTIDITSIGAATLSLPQATSIPEGLKAYTGVLSESTLTLTEVKNVIPAGEAVVLIGKEGSYKFPVSAEPGTAAEKNDLVGNTTSSAITPSVENATICVLDQVNDALGFYKWTGEIPAYKAYLPVSTASSSPIIRIIFGGENANVTAIESISIDGNGNAQIYTLSGRQVKNVVTPGLYIQGGKKILVK